MRVIPTFRCSPIPLPAASLLLMPCWAISTSPNPARSLLLPVRESLSRPFARSSRKAFSAALFCWNTDCWTRLCTAEIQKTTSPARWTSWRPEPPDMAGSYEDAVSELLANGPELAVFLRFNLDSITRLAAALGNPERRLLAVLIAGTNGKGSTAATLAGIVQAAGYRTGLYTSPHLLQINERIQINQEPISNAEFAEIYDRVQSASLQLIQRGTLSSHPSFFEMLTAMMFEYFASAGVELAIVEAGMGGTDDATNIVDPILSIITDVDFDHEDYLGKTLREIAAKKSGIIRSNAPVVLLPQHPEVNDPLGNAILEKNARPVSATKHMPPLTPGSHNYFAHKANQVPRAVFPLLFMGKEILVNSPLVGG